MLKFFLPDKQIVISGVCVISTRHRPRRVAFLPELSLLIPKLLTDLKR